MQAHLREHFGIPEPIQEHRADQDVAVLAAIARQLIQLGVHSTFEEAVEASLRDNAVYAQHCSVVKKRTGVRRLSLKYAIPQMLWCTCDSLNLTNNLFHGLSFHQCSFQRRAATESCSVALLLRTCREA